MPRLLVALLFFIALQFTLQNYRLTYLWDGYQIWATKAMVLYDRGELTQSVLTPHDPDLVSFPNCCDGAERVAAYPQALPLFEALVAKLEGQFNWEAVKAVFPILFVSLLVSTFEAARAFARPVPALCACLLLSALPAVSEQQSIGGYADMPQAALFAAFLAALFRGDDRGSPSYRRSAPWLLGGMLLVKSEGAVLFYVSCALILLVWALRGPRGFVSELRRNAGGAAIALACAFLRAVYLAWMDTKDLTYGPLDKRHALQAYQRLWVVPQGFAHFMLNRADWGIFWLVFLFAIPIILWKGGVRDRVLTIGVLAAIVAYNFIFYFTNWEVHLHMEQACTRLLIQIAPAAAILTVVAYQYIATGRLPIQATETTAIAQP